MISGKTLFTSSLAFLLLAFAAPVLADSIKRIVHADGTVEYTNVKGSGDKRASTKDEVVYRYTDDNGVVAYSGIQPASSNFDVIRFHCYACDPDSNVNWRTTPLFLSPYRDEIKTAAREFNVDPALVRAVIHAESAFNDKALSPKGAQGLMQLMPATAAFVTQDRRYRNSHRHLLHDPELNLEIAQKYIVHLLNERIVDGSLVRLLAAYNGGPGNLSKWLRKIDYPDDVYLLIEGLPARETRNYIKSVLTDMSFYRLKYGQDTPVLRDVVSAGRKADHVNLLLGMNIPKLATP